MNGFLLDTNNPSELTYPRPQPRVERWLAEVDQGLFLSVISVAEVCKGISKLPDSKKRVELQTWLDTVLRPGLRGESYQLMNRLPYALVTGREKREASGRLIKDSRRVDRGHRD